MKSDIFHNESNKLNAIIEAFDYGITILDKEYNIFYQNQILKDTFGGIGKKCYSLYEGKKKVCSECPVEKSFKDGKRHNSISSKTLPSGELQYWENISKPLVNDNGKMIACLELKTDITQQIKMEEKVVTSQQKWKDVFDTITDSITIHDENFNIVSSNKSAKEMLKIKLSNSNNKKIKCFKYFHGSSAPPEGCPSCKCLQTAKPYTTELFETHLNKFLEIRAIPRLGPNKQILGLIHIARDISQKKKLENVLNRSTEDLIARTKKLEEANTAMKVLLEQREMDKKELEDKVMMNVKTLIRPYIRKLKEINHDTHSMNLINSLDFNLKEITSSFSLKASSSLVNLTPTEIRIANLIKEGKQSKEIAEIMSTSIDTVNTHRQNIRKKFGLNNGKINLTSFLLSLSK